MTERKPFALLIVIVLLLVFGGVFYVAIDSLTKEIATPPRPGRGVTRDGKSISIPALKAAIEAGNIAAIKAELAKGNADINDQFGLLESGRRQVSLLTYAAMQGNATLIRDLIAGGAKPEGASDDWGTPLMMAAAKGDLASMTELLKAGAKVDDRNKWGETALIMAVRFGSADKVNALLEAGASVKLADNEGNTPLAAAAGSEAPAAIAKILIDAHAEVDNANRDGVTPLMLAAKLGDVDKCTVLLTGGANVGIKDGNGWTALEWAKQRSDSSGDRCADVLAQAIK
jgi:ankyrin repeat protein